MKTTSQNLSLQWNRLPVLRTDILMQLKWVPQDHQFTVQRALPWPPNKLFLLVSQSEYANLINSHASLQSPTGKWRTNELLKNIVLYFMNKEEDILIG